MSHASRRRVPGARIVSAATIAVAALAVLVPSSAGARRVAHVAATPSCSSSQLVNWLETEPNATAGTDYYTLEFTNFGRTCTLHGYPGVSAVSLSGKQIGNPARRVTGVKLKTVTIRKGSFVMAQIGIIDPGVFSASRCRPVPAAGLRVFTPNTHSSTVIPFPFVACSSTASTSLTVRPVVR